MCKASQPLASANYKLDLVYGKSSPVISQLQCRIVIFAPLIQLKKKKREREICLTCVKTGHLWWTKCYFRKKELRATCWLYEAAKSSTEMILQCLPRPPLSSPKLAGLGPSRALCYLECRFLISPQWSSHSPSVQPQCSPFPAQFKDLQTRRKASPTCEASTGPPGSLCPVCQTKPHEQLRGKGPTIGAGSALLPIQ